VRSGGFKVLVQTCARPGDSDTFPRCFMTSETGYPVGAKKTDKHVWTNSFDMVSEDLGNTNDTHPHTLGTHNLHF